MFGVLRPRLPRLLLAILFGVLSLGSALALAGVSAWLITRAWQMPPVLDLSVAVVAVRAFGISRGVLHYCERLASHDTALRRGLTSASGSTQAGERPGRAARRSHSGRPGVASVPPSTNCPMCWCARCCRSRSPRSWAGRHGDRADLAGRRSRARRVPAGGRRRRAVAGRAGRDGAGGAGGPSFRPRHSRDACARACARAADQSAASMTSSRKPTAATRLGARPRPGGGTGRFGGGGADRRDRRQRARRRRLRVALASSVAPTTVAVLMLLPLSAFEATTALPAAAVQLARSRLAARRLHALTSAGGVDSRRPTVPRIQLDPGARLAVTGPSGAGKTTLLMTSRACYPTRHPLRQRSSPRTHTCSPPPCGTTCWWPAATPPTTN